jgi:hypothetical protein
MIRVLHTYKQDRKYDFLEAKLETLMFKLWQLCSTDMYNINDTKILVSEKSHFVEALFYTYYQLGLSYQKYKRELKENPKLATITVTGMTNVNPKVNLDYWLVLHL